MKIARFRISVLREDITIFVHLGNVVPSNIWMYECKVALGGHQKRSTLPPLFFKTHYFHDNQIIFGTIKRFFFVFFVWPIRFETCHTNHVLNILRWVGYFKKLTIQYPPTLVMWGAQHSAQCITLHTTYIYSKAITLWGTLCVVPYITPLEISSVTIWVCSIGESQVSLSIGPSSWY